MRKSQKIISFLLALVMVIGMVPPVAVHAEEMESTIETVAVETVEEETAAETTVAAEEMTVPTETLTEPTEETFTPTEAATEPEESVSVMEATETNVSISDKVIYQDPMKNIVQGGAFGEGFSWTLDSEGTLHVSGSGAMPDFESNEAPWYSLRNSIRELVIDEGITHIGSYAFQEFFRSFDDPIHIVLPDSVVTIGERAFDYCRINYLTLPAGLRQLNGRMFFGGLFGLEQVTVSERNPYFVVKDNVVFSRNGSVLHWCAGYRWGTYNVPEGTSRIGEYAFSFSDGLSNITLPNGLTSIGKGAFEGCNLLDTMVIPEGVRTIGTNAFQNCAKLKSVSLPASLEGISAYQFWGCQSLESVNIPYGITKIDEGAFMQSGITAISIPESVTYIGDSAFYLSKLQTVEIPASVTNLGNCVFGYCEDLKNARVYANVASLARAFQDCINLETVILPDALTSLDCFQNCNSLKSISIPDSVSRIESSAFENCWFLTALTLPEGITSLGDSAFSGCAGLTNMVIPKTVTELGWGLFAGCSSLTEVIFKGSGESLNDWNYQDNLFQGVTATAYYPRNDDSWTELLKEGYTFGGNITWISYDADQDVTGRIREFLDNSSITINSMGSAYAYYVTMPNVTVWYQIRDDVDWAKSNDRGLIMIPLGSFSEEGEHSVKIRFTEVGGEELIPAITMEAIVTVEPLHFTQDWKFSFSGDVAVTCGGWGTSGRIGPTVIEAEAAIGKVGVGLGGGRALQLKREYSADRVDIELTSDIDLDGSFFFKSGVSGKVSEAKFDLVSTSAGIKAGMTGNYGIRIEDYTGKISDSVAVGTFLLGEVLGTTTNNIFLVPFYDSMAEKVYNGSNLTTITGSGASCAFFGKGKLAAVEINDQDVFSGISGDREHYYSISQTITSRGEREKEVSHKSESKLLLLNDVLFEGTLGKSLLGTETTVKAKYTGNDTFIESESLTEENDEYRTFMLGKSQTFQYDRYTFRDEALDGLLNNTRNFNAFLHTDRGILWSKDLEEMAAVVSYSNVPVEYSRIMKDETVYSFPMGFGIALGKGIEANVDLSWMKSNSYTSADGFAIDDQLYLINDSDLEYDVKEASVELDEFIEDSFHALKQDIQDFFKIVSRDIKKGVKAACAWIKEQPQSIKNWVLSLTYAEDKNGGGAWALSYDVAVHSAQKFKTMLSEGVTSFGSGNFELSRAATIGRPILVGVEDTTTGEVVIDLSEEPLELTIQYASEDLKAAGLNKNSSIVQSGGIAMYRYSDDGDYFEHVGGTNDLDAMTVTATIVKTGQYVLAVDACAPQISSLDVSDFRETPTITARIDDLTGLDQNSFVFTIDGDVKVDSSNIEEHYNTNAGIFTYTVPETEALTEGPHTIAFTLSDTSENKETYEYAFPVDLTAPVISDVTVDGFTNAGSAVMIRANVRDENLSTVYAVFSKQLPDGTWSKEAVVEMGEMGDGLWGLDYEGDGSTVKVYVKALDIADNEISGEVCEANPFVEMVTMARDYVVLRQGQQEQLTAEVAPVALTTAIEWRSEEESVASVDESGTVTAKGIGTTYIIASVTDASGNELTARCRVDVTESIQLNGVQLGTAKLTTELYSTDYAQFELLLELPQNASLMSADRKDVPEDKGVAIESVKFEAATTAVAFDLVALDDRHIAVVPTEYALEYPEELAKSYKSAVTVTVDGQEYTTEEILTLTVKQSKPKLKAAIPAFNSFYNGQTQAITITGGTVTNISLNPAKTPTEWLTLNEDFTLSLNDSAAKKSAKVYLLVETEEWNIPAEVTLSVKNAYKAPGLKLNTTSVKIAESAAKADINLQLLPKSKNDTLVSLNVADISAPDGYEVQNFKPETGTFTLKANNGFKSDKITLQVKINGTEETVPLTLTVKIEKKAPTVSFKASGNLDLSRPNHTVTVKPTFKNYSGRFTFEETETEQFKLKQDGNVISVQCKEGTKPGTYTVPLKLSLDGGSTIDGSVKLTVKQTAIKLKLSSSKLSLNSTISDQASVTVTCTTKGYDLKDPIVNVMDKSGQNSSNGLYAAYSNGKLTVSVNGNTKPDTTYKVLVKAYEGAPAATLTVSTLKANKSTITASLKAKGSIDVIRDGTAITLTPSYKNCSNTAERTETLLVLDKDGKVIADSSWEENTILNIQKDTQGRYILTRVSEAKLDHTQKYTVKLISDFGGDAPVTAEKAMKLKMGSTKLTLKSDSNILFSRDSYSRVNFSLTAKDVQLNDISEVSIKTDKNKYDEKLDIIPYGNGKFAIGFKNETVHSSLIGKTVTVTVNISLEGNETEKANTTAKLKVTILK